MNVLIWFKRDLRCQHHPALQLGSDMGRVLPMYIVEPDYWQLPDTSARQWDFTAECLTELRDDLTLLGAPLIVRIGDAVANLDKICRQHHIARIISHQETGNAWCIARDARVADWCQTAGIEWIVLPQPVVTDLTLVEDTCPTLPHLIAVAGLEPGPIPTFKSLKLQHDPCPHRQSGGRSKALLQMQSFLQVRAATYRTDVQSLLAAERSCSRLSAHLAMGTLSIAEVAAAASLRQTEQLGKDWQRGLGKFRRQLVLREQCLVQPDVAALVGARIPTVQVSNAGFLDRQTDHLAAWRAGQTGMPFLDACMRYLNATGWLNFASRKMVLQTATDVLGIAPSQAGHHLARRTTDYDPRLHWAHVLATLGAGKPRDFPAMHPVKHGFKLDPTGVFIRRWVPELASVPTQFIHEPWKWSGFHASAGKRYPAPIVQLSTLVSQQRPAKYRDFAPVEAQNHSQSRVRRVAMSKPTLQLLLDI